MTGAAAGKTMKASVFLSMSLIFAATIAAAEPTGVIRHIDGTSDRTPVHTVAPEYPRTARRDRVEGEVQVCYHIDKKGRPYRVAVRNSTHRIFERPAIRAVRASLYKPLEDGEQASPMKTCRTFRFELSPTVAAADD